VALRYGRKTNDRAWSNTWSHGCQTTLNEGQEQIAIGKPKERVYSTTNSGCGAQRELDEIQPPFVRDMRQKAPQVFQVIERRRAALFQRYFGNLLLAGQRAGMVRKDVPANLIIEILLAIVQAIMNPAKMEKLGMMPNEGFAGILRIVLQGALTPKGRKHARIIT